MTVEIQKNQKKPPLLANVTPGGSSGILLFTFLILKKTLFISYWRLAD